MNVSCPTCYSEVVMLKRRSWHDKYKIRFRCLSCRTVFTRSTR